MEKETTELSRAVSHALRHEPWLYELEIDDEGWASTKGILVALRGQRAEWARLAEKDLVHMIESSRKRRHEIRGGRIRALYGHSIPAKLKRRPATPPAVLYHGTSPDVVGLIKASGLLPMGRQYVHLSVDSATAVEVGRRKAKTPVVLTILAQQAHWHGLRFYEGNDKVWLADRISPEFIKINRLA